MTGEAPSPDNYDDDPEQPLLIFEPPSCNGCGDRAVYRDDRYVCYTCRVSWHPNGYDKPGEPFTLYPGDRRQPQTVAAAAQANQTCPHGLHFNGPGDES